MNREIGGIMFNSQKEIKEYVRKHFFERYLDKEPFSPEDHSFALALLCQHPASKQKIGVGVKRIWVQKNNTFPSRGFYLERIDGTRTDFSYQEVISPKPPLQNFKSACRRAVAMEIFGFSQKYFEKQSLHICPLSGKAITATTSHVDHEPPNTFDAIVNKFLEMTGIDVEKEGLLIDHVDGSEGKKLADKKTEEAFTEFHSLNAKLRVISIDAHKQSHKKISEASYAK